MCIILLFVCLCYLLLWYVIINASKNVGNQIVSGSHWHSVFFPYFSHTYYTIFSIRTFGYPYSSENLIYVQQKKENTTSLEQLEEE